MESNAEAEGLNTDECVIWYTNVHVAQPGCRTATLQVAKQEGYDETSNKARSTLIEVGWKKAHADRWESLNFLKRAVRVLNDTARDMPQNLSQLQA